jgi:hypothetical protein
VKIDVMDCLWNHIYLHMLEKWSPSFSPYIMKLICKTWRQNFNGVCLQATTPLTKHPRKKLLIKDHGLTGRVAPATTAHALATAPATPKTTSAGPSATHINGFPVHMGLGPCPNSIYDPMLEPPWYKKLKIKVKKTFYLQLDIQERMYDAYVAKNKA